MTGFVAPTCTCGHPAGTHGTSGSASLYATVRYGRCWAKGCDCREYVETKAA